VRSLCGGPVDERLIRPRLTQRRSYQKRFANYQPRMKWTGDKDAAIEFNVKGLTLL
jgi:hypothetical protein